MSPNYFKTTNFAYRKMDMTSPGSTLLTCTLRTKAKRQELLYVTRSSMNTFICPHMRK